MLRRFPCNVSMENAMRLRGALGTRGAAAGGRQGLSHRQKPGKRGTSPCLPRREVSMGTVLPGQGRRRAAPDRGRSRSTAPEAGGAGRVLPLVNWVGALRVPSLAHELVIFIRVHNILPCKAMLFSTPSTNRLIMELKLLVINPPKDSFLGHRASLAGAEISAGLRSSVGVAAAAP